jgi:hypothetical protein
MPKVVTLNGKDYLTYFDQKTKLLFMIQLDSSGSIRGIDTISLLVPVKNLYQDIEDYFVVSRDSILVALNPAMTRFYTHDSTVFLLDRSGAIKAVANFDGAPVITWSKVNSHSRSRRVLIPKYPNYLTYNTFSPLIYSSGHNGFFSPFTCFSTVCRSCD